MIHGPRTYNGADLSTGMTPGGPSARLPEMSGIEIRVVGADEYPEVRRAAAEMFGVARTEEHHDDIWSVFHEGRYLAAFDGSEVVGTAGALPMELTVPGGDRPRAAGVTSVTVRTTHRRRGILRALMTRQLAQVGDRGEPFAILTASESGIYGRFGYGPAVHVVGVEIDEDHNAFAVDPGAAGRMEIHTGDGFVDAARVVYEQVRRIRPGMVSRPAETWRQIAIDPPGRRGGASGWFAAVHHDTDGLPDGYALWRLRRAGDWAGHAGVLELAELVATDPGVDAALWRLVLDVDLVRTVRYGRLPTDSPLRWRLAEPRRLRTVGIVDHLWVRPADPRVALVSRRYHTPGSVRLEIVDPLGLLPRRTLALDGGPDGADVTRGSGPAEVTVGLAELGAVILGGVRWRTLAAAGRVAEHAPGAVGRLDAMFTWPADPWCCQDF